MSKVDVISHFVIVWQAQLVSFSCIGPKYEKSMTGEIYIYIYIYILSLSLSLSHTHTHTHTNIYWIHTKPLLLYFQAYLVWISLFVTFSNAWNCEESLVWVCMHVVLYVKLKCSISIHSYFSSSMDHNFTFSQ